MKINSIWIVAQFIVLLALIHCLCFITGEKDPLYEEEEW